MPKTTDTETTKEDLEANRLHKAQWDAAKRISKRVEANLLQMLQLASETSERTEDLAGELQEVTEEIAGLEIRQRKLVIALAKSQLEDLKPRLINANAVDRP